MVAGCEPLWGSRSALETGAKQLFAGSQVHQGVTASSRGMRTRDLVTPAQARYRSAVATSVAATRPSEATSTHSSALCAPAPAGP